AGTWGARWGLAGGRTKRTDAAAAGWNVATLAQMKKAEPEMIPGSLRERLGNKSATPQTPPPLKPIPRNRPSARPYTLAFRALGYATVLTTCSATASCIAIKWYYNIESVEDLIWRLKRNVPRHGDNLKSYIGPPLESIRDGLLYFFKTFRPMMAPKGNDADLSKTLEQEKKELRMLGVDAHILDPIPEPPRNIGKPSPPSSDTAA
ncbi:Uncharacterized protein SCF082_LOCUS36413, partial [Durusdinium trenchii]